MEEVRNQSDSEKLEQIKNILAQSKDDVFEDGIFEEPRLTDEIVALAKGLTDIEAKKSVINSILSLRKQIVEMVEYLAWGAASEIMQKRTRKREQANYASIKMALDIIFSVPTKEEANLLWEVLDNHLKIETYGFERGNPVCGVIQDYVAHDAHEYSGPGNDQKAYSKFRNDIHEKFQGQMQSWQLLPEQTDSSMAEGNPSLRH